jgi:hypothetical protein
MLLKTYQEKMFADFSFDNFLDTDDRYDQ